MDRRENVVLGTDRTGGRTRPYLYVPWPVFPHPSLNAGDVSAGGLPNGNREIQRKTAFPGQEREKKGGKKRASMYGEATPVLRSRGDAGTDRIDAGRKGRKG